MTPLQRLHAAADTADDLLQQIRQHNDPVVCGAALMMALASLIAEMSPSDADARKMVERTKRDFEAQVWHTRKVMLEDVRAKGEA